MNSITPQKHVQQWRAYNDATTITAETDQGDVAKFRDNLDKESTANRARQEQMFRTNQTQETEWQQLQGNENE